MKVEQHSSSFGRAVAVLLVLACAALLIVLAFLNMGRRGPEGLYERARASRNLSIRIGPNEFRVDSVVRWDRLGSPAVEDGRGRELKKADFELPDFTRQSPWLDLASISISSQEPYHVLELRVFDHETRKLLSADDRTGAGFEFTGSRVELRSAGALLPETVDVWFRVMHLPRNSAAWKLSSQTGASAPLLAGKISLREIREGSWGYTLKSSPEKFRSEIQWKESEEDGDIKCTAVFDWTPGPDGSWSQRKYQICAAGTVGELSFPDFPHFVQFPPRESTKVITFGIPRSRLSHFIVRPFHGRDVFYFDGVRLPRVTQAPAAEPPAATIPVGGKEIDTVIRELDPLRIRVQALRGKRVTGISGHSGYGRLHWIPEPIPDLDTKSTVIYEITGFVPNRCHVDLLDREGNKISPTPGEEHQARGTCYLLGTRVKDIPLREIASIQIRLSR